MSSTYVLGVASQLILFDENFIEAFFFAVVSLLVCQSYDNEDILYCFLNIFIVTSEHLCECLLIICNVCVTSHHSGMQQKYYSGFLV